LRRQRRWCRWPAGDRRSGWPDGGARPGHCSRAHHAASRPGALRSPPRTAACGHRGFAGPTAPRRLPVDAPYAFLYSAPFQAPFPMPHTDRVKCLLVDDVVENLVALEALLQRDDIEILKAQSGPEALELLLTHNDVALALLDVQMPDMNGFELAELIRGSERTRGIPLIFMTAGSREQNWQFRGYESGAVDLDRKSVV